MFYLMIFQFIIILSLIFKMMWININANHYEELAKIEKNFSDKVLKEFTELSKKYILLVDDRIDSLEEDEKDTTNEL